jgi:hypothetical protein
MRDPDIPDQLAVVAYAASMNVVIALVWVATGAVLVGVATAAARRRRDPRSSRMAFLGFVSLGSFFLSCFWLVVPPVNALSTTIDSALPVDVTCDSAWSALQGFAVRGN